MTVALLHCMMGDKALQCMLCGCDVRQAWIQDLVIEMIAMRSEA